MIENKNEENIPGSSSKSIKMDLIRFKDDILKDMREIQISLNKKYSKTEDYLRERLNKFELKMSAYENKITEYSNLINIDNSLKENIESLNQFKEETKDTIFKRRAKYSEFEKKMDEEINRINKILMDSVIYPGIIGGSAKFKTYHDFMDYVLMEIGQLMVFKDKNGLDITPFKRKIEQTVEAFRIQINNVSTKEFTNNAINQLEERINSLFKLNDERLKGIKYENANYNFNINKKLEEINKQIEILYKFKNRMENNDNLYMNFKNELFIIKNEINQINEILKKLISFHPNIDKKTTKIVSGVKQYIDGRLNANQLFTMKVFTSDKIKGKKNEMLTPAPTSPNTSGFISPQKFKNNSQLSKRNSYAPNISYLFNKGNKNNIMIDNNISNNNDNHFDENQIFYDLNASDIIKKKGNNLQSPKRKDKEKDYMNSYKINKRNTYAFDQNFLESNKLNIKLINIKEEKENNSKESQLKKNNKSNLNNSNDGGLDEDKNKGEKNKKELEKNAFNNEKNNNINNKSENHDIIKEEEENEKNLSDNSSKNLGDEIKIDDKNNSKNIDIINKDKKILNNTYINKKPINKNNSNTKIEINSNNIKSNIEKISNEKNKEKNGDINNITNNTDSIVINNNNIKIIKDKLNDNNNTNSNNNENKRILNFQKQNILNNNISDKNKLLSIKKTKEINQSVPLFNPYNLNIPPNKGGNVIESNDIYNKNNYSSSSGGSPFKNLNVNNRHNNNSNEEKKIKLSPNHYKMNKINNIPIINNNTPTYTTTAFPLINKSNSLGKKVNPIKNLTFFNSDLKDFKNMSSIEITGGTNINNDNMKIIENVKKPKKVLLTKPNNYSSNTNIRKYNNNQNKSNAYKSQQKNRDKFIEKMFDPFEMKNKVKNFNNIQNLNPSIYHLISSHD